MLWELSGELTCRLKWNNVGNQSHVSGSRTKHIAMYVPVNREVGDRLGFQERSKFVENRG